MNAQTSLKGNENPSLPLLRNNATDESWILSEKSISDAPKLAAKLKDNEDDKYSYLFSRFTTPNQEFIKSDNGPAGDSTAIRKTLVEAFNKIIQVNILLSDEAIFKQQPLSKATQKLLEILKQKAAPSDPEIFRVNRLILEESVPELASSVPHWQQPEKLSKSLDARLIVDDLRQKCPRVATWMLIQALCGFPNPNEDPLAGILPIVGDLKEPVCGDMDRETWFKTLSTQLNEIDKTNPVFAQLIVSYWGPLMIEEKSGQSTKSTLNVMTFAALCAANLRLWYDPREGAFYLYSPEFGTWSFVTEAEVQRILLEYLLDSDFKQQARPSLRLALDILKHLKIIALYERTEPPSRPVHLGHEMLFVDNPPPVAFSPAYFSKNRIPIEYQKDAYAAKFIKFLEESLSEEDIDLLQKWCGFVILGINPFHKILLIRGVGGSGKSTLMDILEAVIGTENVASLNIERLDDRFELAGFRDKILLLGKDVAADVFQSKAAHTLKALSGDQGIEAELKFDNNRFKLKGPFNIAVTSNADLEIGLYGDVEAWERRLLVIDFPKAVPAKARIANFSNVLLKENSAGILNWMLEGAKADLHMLRMNEKLVLTIAQKERLKRLLSQSCSSDYFIESCLMAAPGQEISSDELYESYEEFCDEQVFNPIDRESFYRRIRKTIFRLYGSYGGKVTIVTTDDEGREFSREAKGYKQLAISNRWPFPYRRAQDMTGKIELEGGNIKDLKALITGLSDTSNKFAAYILNHFSAEVKKAMADCANETNVASQIAKQLNEIIKEKSQFQLELIDAIKLREETSQFMKKNPETPIDIKRLKRMLIEDAFPGQIVQLSIPTSKASAKGYTNNSGTIDFVDRQITDLKGLISDLQNSDNKIAVKIMADFPPPVKDALAKCSNPGNVQKQIAKVLNGVIKTKGLYQAELFAGVALRKETAVLIQTEPKDAHELRRLNRMLIEDAFPGRFCPLSVLTPKPNGTDSAVNIPVM